MTLSPDNLTLPLVFISGVLGSSHCLGMCGAISAAMSAGTTSVRSSLTRQILWSLGRCLTYVFLGLMAAALGGRLAGSAGSVSHWQAMLAIGAGCLMILQGLHSAGHLRLPQLLKPASSCPSATVLSSFLRGGSGVAVFVAGLITGFLPCGLVYSFLLLSAASGSILTGMLIMASFGLGTLPVMLATGTGMSLLGWTIRRKMLQWAAYCVMIAGLLTTCRGVAAAVMTSNGDPAACPLCEPDATDAASFQTSAGQPFVPGTSAALPFSDRGESQ